MATFPQLKTGAVAQYPAGKSLHFRNQALRFLDGSEQRYRDSTGPLHQWIIQLNELDPTEVSALEEFFEANQGRLGSFSFIDPWDATQYPTCSLASDDFDVTSLAEVRATASLTIVENRS
jgi:hypothetical protein